MKIVGDPKKEKIVTILVSVFFIGVITITTLLGNFNDKKLIERGVIINATIYDVTSTVRGDFAVKYRFFIAGKPYESEHSYGEIISRYQSNFINKSFPMIYLSEDPSINYLLVTPNSFKKYNKDFPDSLGWVKNYMN
ncbi:MAG TPA: hypothetical protein VK718_10860 [Ferruginibacter sp.]|jgi:hypothetical protein|nr:hypothetical protein [Ferruginibacter sp.]